MRSASRATVLIDTNVLVYQHDPRDTVKQAQANEVFREIVAAERAALSVQCLSEFYSTTTRRLPERLDPETALAQVARLTQICVVVDLTARVVLEACRGSAGHEMSLWDALIWAAAKVNAIPYVLTEDAEHERFLEGVTYLNPFDRRFEISALLA